MTNIEELLRAAKAQYLNQTKGSWPLPWHTVLVDEIVEAVARHLGTTLYCRASEPQGVAARVYATFYAPGPDLHGTWDKREGKVLCWLNFEPMDLSKAEIGVVDYTRRVHEFPPGSIGDINALQYVAVPLPETIEELAEFGKVRKEV